MLEIIVILLIGIILGRIFSRLKSTRKLAEGMSVTVWMLIFALGFSVGADSAVMNRIPALGTDALVIALLATGGSMLTVMAIRKFIKPKGKQ